MIESRRNLCRGGIGLAAFVAAIGLTAHRAAGQGVAVGAAHARTAMTAERAPVGASRQVPLGQILLSTEQPPARLQDQCQSPECRTTRINFNAVTPSLFFATDVFLQWRPPEFTVRICANGVISGPNCRPFVEEYSRGRFGILERQQVLEKLSLPGCFRLVWDNTGLQSRSFAILRSRADSLRVPCFD